MSKFMGTLVQEEKWRDLREMLSLKGRKEQNKVDPAAVGRRENQGAEKGG